MLRPRTGIRSIIANGGIFGLVYGGEAALRGLYAVIIGIMLGPGEYGAWSYAATVYATALVVTSFGIESLVEARSGRRLTGSDTFAAGSLAIRLATAIALFICMVPVVWLLEQDARLQLALLLVLPAILGRGIASWVRSLLTAREAPGVAFRVGVPMRLIEIVVGLTILSAGGGVISLLALHALSWLAEALIGWVAVRRLIPGFKPTFDRAVTRLIFLSGQLMAVTVIGIAALNALPILAAKWLGFSLDEIGNLGIVLQFSSLFVIAAQGFLAALFPAIGRAAQSGHPHLARLAWLSCAGLVLAAILAAWISALVGETIIVPLLGSGFREAAALLPISLLLAGVILAPIGAWQILVVHERFVAGALGSCAALVLGIALLVPSTDQFGIAGILYAALAGWTLRAIILMIAVTRYERATQKPT
ncbi:lipopolysaccharide biosynthesis protein [Aurantiacibacter gangjinensis]|uniref:Uncharacterized protein n=1 Tax=Aurantiacibacter gangjinensis TaxID=502682 RepID=A0A0G9MR83_9SPHN|nr:oligosaccharide flippase family protein [Aurantiacibacter gangjinensis]APE29147.1 hypothetical protein BMF35_a2318 [Aurantiacibacter gangjinensis]KLE33222.1 hypothetical protein AAW01_04470 [Aurantiacibacter gangjinensis]